MANRVVVVVALNQTKKDEKNAHQHHTSTVSFDDKGVSN